MKPNSVPARTIEPPLAAKQPSLPGARFVLLGGGGFSMNTSAPTPLDRYLVALTGKRRPRIMFVPTAGGDAVGYCQRFEAAFAELAETSVFGLFGGDYGYGRKADLLDQDLIFVGGGSTINLLAVWRAHGLPAVLADAACRGTILAGISAGANCWAQGSSTDSTGEISPLRDGLGWLPGSICPHYRGEAGRRELFHHWVADGSLPDGYGIDDGAAMYFQDGSLIEVVAEQPHRSAFRVERSGDGSRETRLPARGLTCLR